MQMQARRKTTEIAKLRLSVKFEIVREKFFCWSDESGAKKIETENVWKVPEKGVDREMAASRGKFSLSATNFPMQSCRLYSIDL